MRMIIKYKCFSINLWVTHRSISPKQNPCKVTVQKNISKGRLQLFIVVTRAQKWSIVTNLQTNLNDLERDH